eukprot:scaffold166337_cov14-Tisochrysis_lutea.AAC.1
MFPLFQEHYDAHIQVHVLCQVCFQRSAARGCAVHALPGKVIEDKASPEEKEREAHNAILLGKKRKAYASRKASIIKGMFSISQASKGLTKVLECRPGWYNFVPAKISRSLEQCPMAFLGMKLEPAHPSPPPNIKLARALRTRGQGHGQANHSATIFLSLKARHGKQAAQWTMPYVNFDIKQNWHSSLGSAKKGFADIG